MNSGAIKEILEDYMIEKDLKKTEFAQMLNISEKGLDNYLKGYCQPELDNAIKIANALQMTLSYLFGLSKKNNYKHEIVYDGKFYQRYIELLNNNKLSHYKASKLIPLDLDVKKDWENGRIPKLATIIKIADFFCVSVESLLFDIDN